MAPDDVHLYVRFNYVSSLRCHMSSNLMSSNCGMMPCEEDMRTRSCRTGKGMTGKRYITFRNLLVKRQSDDREGDGRLKQRYDESSPL